jgi:hypothetical protein
MNIEFVALIVTMTPIELILLKIQQIGKSLDLPHHESCGDGINSSQRLGGFDNFALVRWSHFGFRVSES